MKEILSTITSKGQVTIPAEVRKYLGVNNRDKIAFVVETEGRVTLKVPEFPTIESLAGAAGSLTEQKPWTEVLETAREDHLAQKRLKRHA
jgi:AbrB family looped-hinge helix DNA binding protein